jgi:hypothetical protein
MRAARELAELVRGDAAGTYDLACALARCIPIARSGERDKFAAEAIKTLANAAHAGWNDAARTARDPDLTALHGLDDFDRLLARLFDRGIPTDPFAPP